MKNLESSLFLELGSPVSDSCLFGNTSPKKPNPVTSNLEQLQDRMGSVKQLLYNQVASTESTGIE